MAGLIKTQSQMVQWARSEFARIWRISYDGAYNNLSRWCNMDVPSNARVEFYAAYQSAGDPERWVQGDPIPEEGLDSTSWSITNYKFGKRLRWPREDRADDQTSSLMDAARSAGMKWARLPERLAYQILLAQSNAKLLPSIPNAIDGVGMFSTVGADGSARFGATSGNLLTGTGVSTPANIRNDFWSAKEQFKAFQDTKGEILWDDSYEEAGYLVIHGSHLENEFAQAFIQRITQGTAAGVSNVILDANMGVQRVSTARITTNSWYVVLLGAPHKPLIHQMREGIEEKIAVADNSDSVRDYDIEYIQWRSRCSMGLGLPYQIIQVYNA